MFLLIVGSYHWIDIR